MSEAIEGLECLMFCLFAFLKGVWCVVVFILYHTVARDLSSSTRDRTGAPLK